MAMGFGIAFFFRLHFGTAAVATGLVMLAFVILPYPGLHFFTAGTLTLSCALMLWTYLLRRGHKALKPHDRVE